MDEMKRLSIIALVCVAVAGCSKSETVAVGPNGERATVSNDGKTATYTDDKGNTATVTNKGDNSVSMSNSNGDKVDLGKGISEAELGLPFYPGSTEKVEGSMASTDAAKGESNVMCTRTTKDDPSKVADFYKDKVEGGKVSNMSSGDLKIASMTGKLKDGAEVTISVNKKGSEDTTIMIAVTHKKK